MAFFSSQIEVYRGRLAPSPTGLLHLGHAATFLAAAARAREADGTLALRNDDLDRQRSRAEFSRAMLEDLHWLGIDWQEGPDIGGPWGPYSQSERQEFYLAAWGQLLEAGFLYRCQCSRKDLATAVAAPHENAAEEPHYPGTCRPLAAPHLAAPHHEPMSTQSAFDANWRFRVPDGEIIEFQDQHFGAQRFTAGIDFGDFLVWRRDGVPSYQLACVADDSAMRITEVVRGADLLKSTARQILLYRALGLQAPKWFHCPLVTDAAGERLAKRHDALSIRALREQGRSPRDVIASLEEQLSGSHP